MKIIEKKKPRALCYWQKPITSRITGEDREMKTFLNKLANVLGYHRHKGKWIDRESYESDEILDAIIQLIRDEMIHGESIIRIAPKKFYTHTRQQ